MIVNWNKRKTTGVLLTLAVLFLLLLLILGAVFAESAAVTDFSRKNLAPSLQYPFGTDWLGRDMFARTMVGLSMSIRLGLLTATVSGVFAFLLGTVAAVGGKIADGAVSWVIDLLMGIPHILLLILVAFACGKGFWGVTIGVVLTHWMSLGRVLRGEILSLRESGYIQVAGKLGVPKRKIVTRHLLPHLLPQWTTGIILLFPHAVLHEASITFLGFGLSPEEPAIGIILSESMGYLAMGNWWLAVFPGALLVVVVLLFDYIGNSLRGIFSPSDTHR